MRQSLPAAGRRAGAGGVRPREDTVRELVEARLGRSAQDVLEAAVVLEAWGGFGARSAFDRAGTAVATVRREGVRSVGGHRGEQRQPAAVDAIAFVVAVVTIASWAAPLARSYSGSLVEVIAIALPVSLAVQWFLWARNPVVVGQGSLSPDLLACALALVAGLTVAGMFGAAGVIGACLIVIWVGGAILTRRGWAVAYLVLVGLLTALLYANLSAVATLGTGAGLISCLVVLAVATSAPGGRASRPWARSLAAAAAGGGLGVLLVSDPGIGLGSGDAVPALALLPSAFGGLWASRHLYGLHGALARALEGAPLGNADRIAPAGPGLRLLAGAFGRLAVVTTLLSVALAATITADGALDLTVILVAFGFFASLTLAVSLLEAVGRSLAAVASTVLAVGAAFGCELLAAPAQPGVSLAFGACVGLLVAVPVAVLVMARPGRALATLLWIG